MPDVRYVFPYSEKDLPIGQDFKKFVWCYAVMGVIIALGVSIIVLFEVAPARKLNL